MENKKFIFIGLVIFAILVLGIVNSITEKKTVSECKEIIQKIENESFKGVVFQKPIVNKSTKLIIDSNIGVFRLYPCCPDLYNSSNVGDSIIKLKNTNLILHNVNLSNLMI